MMSNETANKANEEVDPNLSESTEAPASEADESGVDDPVVRLERETADLKDQLLRALAETENTRRRAERDLADARRYAIASFARDMLSVSDNFNRALKAVPEGEIAQDPSVKALIEGIEMTERELLNTLQKHGIVKDDPEGERFDPNKHEALFEVPNESVPNMTIVQVVEPGYLIGERVLRPAKVGVSKGGPKPGA
ncbi:nucleotide exchange factor GrpE [Amorphus sp. 3PC139-8]|uniref:nucleotide exchange factor GrpE n=1 Tax=Amorphus sp. 3PC139-8 TaxID=2735676 RepID=UPI00345D1646